MQCLTREGWQALWQGSMKRGDLLGPLETQVDLVNTPNWILLSLVFCANN